MSDRFFVNEPVASDRATLAGDEARHLTAVMRASVGDEITLFDGTGTGIQDVAASACAYEKARERGVGSRCRLG